MLKVHGLHTPTAKAQGITTRAWHTCHDQPRHDSLHTLLLPACLPASACLPACLQVVLDLESSKGGKAETMTVDVVLVSAGEGWAGLGCGLGWAEPAAMPRGIGPEGMLGLGACTGREPPW